DQYLGRPQFQNPEWEPVELEPLRTRRIVPVYPLTKGIGPQRMRQVMRQAVEQWAPKVAEPLPQALRRRLGLYPLPQALAQAHFPDSQESLGRARRRLVFDELFLLQLGMLGTRRQRQAEPGTPIPTNREALDAFAAGLPFALTAAQGRVIAEIAADVARPQPMTRLLQGDVGSGKTAVAAAAMLLAVRAGRQAALMAPTEILAEQHARSLGELLAAAGVRVGLLTGSTPPAEREQRYAELADGRAQVVVGTHALIQAGVRFHDLGLAVVDEPHRFGVEQRGALRAKGGNGGPAPAGAPHLLVMSATPIPRTLALSLYGDLDLSTLDEMPPDRQEIKTYWLKPGQRERAYRFVRKQVQAGRQAFIICPLVEESDKSEAKAATAEFERLQQHIFPDLKLGLVHGRMRPADKEAAMRAFYAGEHDVLVATSVIEVGVDVPNSTVMLIEGANRFGLAQLHQFRGRVGRGEHQSFCLLLADDGYEGGGERLAALEQSNDGFALAERDLELRGPGEFFGQRQSGLPELRLASLLDLPLLEMARAEAGQLLESDPELARPEHRLLRQKLDAFWSQAAEVS
ncbi:MAG: ATP-dependent DNA helicase RecG, partial [Candidatus Promineifilaceae bacterium]